eukprot:TRINITY_DN42714_c0_g1_i3.p1 TRINITY_DN42714_c0_g1~~TRINITY_DN42714_c0_g1_i3.p1  ORF type:complete len:143 (-),score=9.49 TRINITY_DN42714_c0_g1_i3:36-440(-)
MSKNGDKICGCGCLLIILFFPYIEIIILDRERTLHKTILKTFISLLQVFLAIVFYRYKVEPIVPSKMDIEINEDFKNEGTNTACLESGKKCLVVSNNEVKSNNLFTGTQNKQKNILQPVLKKKQQFSNKKQKFF